VVTAAVFSNCLTSISSLGLLLMYKYKSPVLATSQPSTMNKYFSRF
jgi:hypothetical protein